MKVIEILRVQLNLEDNSEVLKDLVDPEKLVLSDLNMGNDELDLSNEEQLEI